MNWTILFSLYVAKKSEWNLARQITFKNVIAFQNANTMSTKLPMSELRLCPFDPLLNTSNHYICYKHERCCKLGCCSNHGFSYYQSWYFWAIVLVAFLIFYLGSWYCKRVDIRRKRRLQLMTNSRNPSSSSTPQISPRRRREDTMDNYMLDYLVHSYRFHTINETRTSPRLGGTIEPPPKYQEALCMPKRIKSNLQVVQVHTISNGSLQPQNSEGNTEALPTYEDAVQRTKGTEDKNII